MVEFGQRYPCPVGGYGGNFNAWLFSPESLGDFDERLGPFRMNLRQDVILTAPGVTAQQ